ncbi:uncharacterized protein K452DRAFT_238191 [Aplosporella prunicola CBS 121167]|uniref:Cytochrome P450 n=1 Tax=Aplosporella prunicola CBS 121167 TaxID=1176127 RepID=A0A6A6AZ58_9PEZI|nr:uncharacterized protein K452DRAFT_238191 [Aplosporella prunicola CBS 121167]KAF2136067.1 hypothetical protein K452DRAFT_238191 [Aplosporella prunicola CBS 121167]
MLAVYLLYLHPLSRFPGPKLWVLSRLPNARSLRRGTFIHDLKALHDKYGPIVRYSPNKLSLIGPSAWQDIYGHHGGEKNFSRNPLWYQRAPNGAHTILSADNTTHARIRKLLSHAFSEKALKQQEHLIQVYLDLLVTRLKNKADNRPINIKDYFQFTTFDIAGDLEFGESFGCLEKEDYHHWISVMLAHFKRLVLLGSTLMFLPILRPIVRLLIPKRVREQRMQQFEFSRAKVGRRLDVGDDPTRPDFMTYVCRHNDEKGMTRDEIDATFDILVTAGSETTATTMTGILHYLLRYPDKFQKLKDEIRTAFSHPSEIDIKNTTRLPYLTAVINEGLRLCPPAPTMLPRLVPERGAEVCGHWLPGGTSVGVPPWSAFRSASNFASPDSFIPERWINPTKGGLALHPHEPSAFMLFSYGPRNCLGKFLAWAEIRLVLSHLVWNFEVVVKGPGYKWEDQLTFIMWEKQPLVVGLTPVIH